jgi:hypothetical protein
MAPAVSLRSVYLIALDGLHKIGFSADPSERLPQVAPGGRIVHHFPSSLPHQVERALHRRFDHCHVRGEWFRLSDDEVDLICRLARTDAADDLPAELQPPPTDRIRLIVDTDAVIRRAVQLRKAKSLPGESMSDIVTAILRDALAEEIAELERHDRGEDRPARKRRGGE